MQQHIPEQEEQEEKEKNLTKQIWFKKQHKNMLAFFFIWQIPINYICVEMATDEFNKNPYF